MGGGPGRGALTVQWRSGSEEYSDARQQTLATPPATLAGLTNGVAYTVRVRASNAGGDSDWSEEETGRRCNPFPPCRRRAPACSGLLLAWLGGRRRAPGRV